MSDSQRPKPAFGGNEIPDLVLDPVPRPSLDAARSDARGAGRNDPDLFYEEGGETMSLAIELDQDAGYGKIEFGDTIELDAPGLALEPAGQFALLDPAPRPGAARRGSVGNAAGWPSGRAPDSGTLEIDPVEISIAGDYGPAPDNALLTPLYAYRVFIRRRQLERRLARLATARDSAEFERETVLAELARELRAAAEQVPELRQCLTPVVELEQLAGQRGQALSSLTAELGEQGAQFDAELTRSAERVSAQKIIAHQAEAARAERELLLERGEAKRKRVLIEIRALTHTATQKLGTAGGQIPEAEAAQLVLLRQRAETMQPEIAQARADHELTRQALARAEAGLEAEQRAERGVLRGKQALTEQYRKELDARRVGLVESEQRQRQALAELGRAVLGARGRVPIAMPWLERVQSSSARADQAIVRHETERRALHAYDRNRVKQGVRLVCTALVLTLLLISLKLAL